MSRTSAQAPQGELSAGTLPLLILRTLATGRITASRSPAASSRSQKPSCGLSRARSIQRCIEWGSTALVDSYGGTTENNRKAKYYRLTKRGTRELSSETERWISIAAAIATVLQEG
jgi:PadR family transcriptional regulator PadR